MCGPKSGARAHSGRRRRGGPPGGSASTGGGPPAGGAGPAARPRTPADAGLLLAWCPFTRPRCRALMVPSARLCYVEFRLGFREVVSLRSVPRTAPRSGADRAARGSSACESRERSWSGRSRFAYASSLWTPGAEAPRSIPMTFSGVPGLARRVASMPTEGLRLTRNSARPAGSVTLRVLVASSLQ
jgi:hypothetical protein